MKASPASRIQSNLQEIFQSQLSSGTAYVRLKLTEQMDALLPINRIEESHVIAVEKVTPLPGMPHCAIGMMNSREHVFCVFDLAELLSIPNVMLAPQEYQILVINTSGINTKNLDNDNKNFVGLFVSQIQGITRISDENIHNYTDLQEEFSSFITGYILEDQRKTIILDVDIIVSRLAELSDQKIF